MGQDEILGEGDFVFQTLSQFWEREDLVPALCQIGESLRLALFDAVGERQGMRVETDRRHNRVGSTRPLAFAPFSLAGRREQICQCWLLFDSPVSTGGFYPHPRPF